MKKITALIIKFWNKLERFPLASLSLAGKARRAYPSEASFKTNAPAYYKKL